MALRKVTAFFIRDLLEEMSYPLSLTMRWGSILFKLLTFFFWENWWARRSCPNWPRTATVTFPSSC